MSVSIAEYKILLNIALSIILTGSTSRVLSSPILLHGLVCSVLHARLPSSLSSAYSSRSQPAQSVGLDYANVRGNLKSPSDCIPQAADQRSRHLCEGRFEMISTTAVLSKAMPLITGTTGMGVETLEHKVQHRAPGAMRQEVQRSTLFSPTSSSLRGQYLTESLLTNISVPVVSWTM